MDPTLKQNPELCDCEENIILDTQTSHGRILGGHFVNPLNFRSLAMFYRKRLLETSFRKIKLNDFDYEFFVLCTITVLNEEFFITAAHW